MPELPEVETVCRGLQKDLKSRVINKIIIYDPKLKSLNHHLSSLENKKISLVTRLGKQVLIKVDNLYLLIHLRMTGRLIFVKNSKQHSLIDEIQKGEAYLEHKVIRLTQDNKYKHVRFLINCKGGTLYFFDPRRFGTVEYFDKKPELAINSIDALDENLNSYLHQNTSKIKQNVKSFLLNQARIVGIGNIYASEILFLAKIHPERAWSSLSKNETNLVCRYIKQVLTKAIEKGGTTFSDFQSSNGETGQYQNELYVYSREGEKCRKCESLILKITQGSRSTFYCEKCQK